MQKSEAKGRELVPSAHEPRHCSSVQVDFGPTSKRASPWSNAPQVSSAASGPGVFLLLAPRGGPGTRAQVCACSSGSRNNMTQPILHCLLLLHAARGLMAQVQLWPMNATVLLGTNATFNCSVQQQWVAMAWLLKSDVVLIITRDHGPAINNLRYTAQNYSTAQESTWAFTVIGVRQNDTGPVSCDVQNIQKQTAFLDVQGQCVRRSSVSCIISAYTGTSAFKHNCVTVCNSNCS
ncbi:hypothetical protein Z043_100469 [Scleropages formosus]|uniref:Ig-like domain-containing protein n=1 Tax=Scleropages formosus TaxID=113540 RepID=A0A0P7XXA5_SCLFO|nr:hypothetical protein Z043_100469 [Scleropages formosus]